jgi:CRP/FNR family transcriptional regulator
MRSTPPRAPSAPLPDLPLFRDLAPEAARVLAAAPRGHYRRGQALWTAGAEARALAVVLTGRVRVVRAVAAGRSAGRQYGVHAEGPGGTLGEVPFFAGGRYPATAVAAETTTCLLLDRATLARAVAADPELALRWLGRLAARVRRLIERLDEQTGRTVEQRLAALLLARHAASAGAPFALAATQAEAAEEMGTVREVVVRTLRRFRDAGLVGSPARGRYVVRDGSALARLAGP